MAFAGAFHKDETHFSNANAFSPERFLGDNGQYQKDDHVIFFGTGKRRCPGEVLARAEQFLFVANMVQRFQFHNVPDQTLTFHPKMGLVFSPQPFKFTARARN